MTDLNELEKALEYIDPTALDYSDWVSTGMAIKSAGGSVEMWDKWSARDSARYDGYDALCKKWNSFEGEGISEKTIFKKAIQNGYHVPRSSVTGGGEFGFDGVIQDPDVIVDKTWLEREDVFIPKPNDYTDIQRTKDAIDYLTALFDDDEYVGYVVASYKTSEGKYIPANKGCYTSTCGKLVEELRKYKDITYAFGDYDKSAGAWIRFNPLDGEGVKNANVTEFRYALVESDNLDLGTQKSIIKRLELPVACLVYSGNKSLHAIVHIDAHGLDEYKRRVNRLYDVCIKNGLSVDIQNKNPSRLSRMVGVDRGDKVQCLLGTNLGKSSYEEWEEWLSAETDDLPNFENYSDILENGIHLQPELIHGVLREGHQMIFSGESKTGKSMAMVELALAVASGKKWLGMQCEKGKVLYINFEIAGESFKQRMELVRRAMGVSEVDACNIDIWNLRGKAVSLDKLKKPLERRCKDMGFKMVIFDPIYKIFGEDTDENSAGSMARFVGNFDEIAEKLNVSPVYVHHFAKGNQSGKKSIDRASGSGVLARSPDAILTITKLASDDPLSKPCRIEANLREFPDMLPINAWYEFPIHRIDESGELACKGVEGSAGGKKISEIEQFAVDCEEAFEMLEGQTTAGGEVIPVTQRAIAEWLCPKDVNMSAFRKRFERMWKKAGKGGYISLRMTDKFFNRSKIIEAIEESENW